MAKKEGYVIIHKNGKNCLRKCSSGSTCLLNSFKKDKHPLFYVTQEEANKVLSSLPIKNKSNWGVKKVSIDCEYTKSPQVSTKSKTDSKTGYYLFNGKKYFVSGKEPTTDKKKRTIWTNKKNAKKHLNENPGFAMYKNDDDILCEQAVSVANTSEEKLYHLYDASTNEYVLLADGKHATFKSVEAAASYKSALDCINPGNGFHIYDEGNHVVQTNIPQMLASAITNSQKADNSSIDDLLSHIDAKHKSISSKRPVCEEVDKQIESISVIMDEMQKRYVELNKKVDLCNKLFVDIYHLFEFTDYASDAEAAKAMYMFQGWLRQRREMKDTMEKIEMCAGISAELVKAKKQFMNMKKRTYVPRAVDELFKDFM